MSGGDPRGWGWTQRWVRARIAVAGVLFTALFALLAYRTWVLQVREAQHLREMAEDQYLRDVELPARRGRVLDRNGAELAASAEVDSVYANPRQIDAGAGADAVAQALARPLDLDKRDLLGRLHSRRYFAWLKHHVPPDQARAVRDLALPGVYLTKEPRRYYPNRALAGPVLGWAGLDGKGLEGVELRYDKELRGAPAEVQGLHDALGRELLPSGLADAAPQGGRDLVLTVDKFIQYRLERALEAGVAQHRAKAASAVVLDPSSGEILAMASLPTLNPNDPQATAGDGRDKSRGVRNRAVTDPFEPGSTMKTFTITGAIEAGVVKPTDHWFCENGHMRIGGFTVHDAEPIGNATTVEVLAKSSNICTSKIARRLGKQGLDDILRRFGFGAPLGVDLPGERGGQLRPVARWGDIGLATISFGQGVTATQLQVATGYAAIANGGTRYRPHVVRRVLDEKGRVVTDVAPEGTRVVAPAVAETMRQMLRAVTDKGGTAEKLAIPGYPSAGKTGTAQKVDPATRRYSSDKWMSSFVGFAPFDQPRLVIMVTVDEPADTHFGSAVAGPIWREVMADALRYLNVPPTPDAATAPRVAAAPPPAGTSAASAVAARGPQPAVTRAGEEPREEDRGVDGDGDADGDGAAAAEEEAPPGVDVPDLAGLSFAEVLATARRLHLPVDVSGSGRVASQTPPPGRAPEGVRCRVVLAPP